MLSHKPCSFKKSWIFRNQVYQKYQWYFLNKIHALKLNVLDFQRERSIYKDSISTKQIHTDKHINIHTYHTHTHTHTHTHL